ncbi:hypothetical protein GCM10009745_80340 [Kribbella yunnanensis]|uniref:Uncharacterized protein n=1 Tax=Kribbella yunnanensis TaxID=190194 RepID=A0ABN2J715_9ACTN
MAGYLQHVTIRQRDTIAGAAMAKVFDMQGTSPAPTFGDLSPGRRTFLRALADHPGALNYNQFPGLSLERLLPAARLPEIGNALRRYTGLPPANKVDDRRQPRGWPPQRAGRGPTVGVRGILAKAGRVDRPTGKDIGSQVSRPI